MIVIFNFYVTLLNSTNFYRTHQQKTCQLVVLKLRNPLDIRVAALMLPGSQEEPLLEPQTHHPRKTQGRSDKKLQSRQGREVGYSTQILSLVEVGLEKPGKIIKI